MLVVQAVVIEAVENARVQTTDSRQSLSKVGVWHRR